MKIGHNFVMLFFSKIHLDSEKKIEKNQKNNFPSLI